MAYTIGQMAKLLGISASTLRYYDKEGILPPVKRSSSGVRLFEEKDFEWLNLVECLKKAGMSIGEIRQYIEMAAMGDATIDERLALLEQRKALLEAQMAELCRTMEVLDYKCWFYRMAKEKGGIEPVRTMGEDAIPEQFRTLRKNLRKQPLCETRYE